MKLLRQLGLAAVVGPLFCASGALAQVMVNNSSDQNKDRLGPSYAPVSGSSRDYLAPGGSIFPEQASGISLSRLPVLKEDGSPSTRSGLVGSWEVADRINVGIGLFRVTRYSHDKPERFTRVKPMSDVHGDDEKLAAVGMSFRF